ncbi:MAG TPA: hypothetical protein VF788_01740 [Pseudonocardiaceae bacterium]
MAEATQFDPERLRLTLDNGEEMELNGDTLGLDGEVAISCFVYTQLRPDILAKIDALAVLE